MYSSWCSKILNCRDLKKICNGSVQNQQEFSVVNYYETHRLDKYLKIVGDVYDGFIDVHDTNLTAHPISELPDFSMNMVNAGKVATDLFFF